MSNTNQKTYTEFLNELIYKMHTELLDTVKLMRSPLTVNGDTP